MTIEWTTAQTGAFLGVSNPVVLRMVRNGHLKPVNTATAGKRFHPRFNPSDIRIFKQSRSLARHLGPAPSKPNGTNGHVEAPFVPPAAPTAGINTRLDAMNEKIDRIEAVLSSLLALWK